MCKVLGCGGVGVYDNMLKKQPEICNRLALFLNGLCSLRASLWFHLTLCLSFVCWSSFDLFSADMLKMEEDTRFVMDGVEHERSETRPEVFSDRT